jgi:hypothetical protein
MTRSMLLQLPISAASGMHLVLTAEHMHPKRPSANVVRALPLIRLRLENLLVRFEEPSSMVRWDSPLFTVAWTEEDVPAAQIAQAITSGNVKPPNSGTLAVRA